MKACSVIPSLLLQKPSQHCRPKENSACLEKRLISCKKGDIAELLREGCLLQASLERALCKGRRDQENKLARTFFKLMFQRKTNAAIDLLAKCSNGGVLKTWLVVKKQHLSKANELFSGTEVQITTQGCPYLGAPLGSDLFIKEFGSMKVKDWCD